MWLPPAASATSRLPCWRVVLDALLETRSVKGAAARVALSPSATSHALGRLRDLFDDPLLVRAGRSLVPTTRAEALAPALHRLMEDLEGLLDDDPTFDPALRNRTFSMVASDYVQLVVLDPVGRELTHRAPGIDLHCRREGGALESLRTGEIDLMFPVTSEVPADIRICEVLTETFSCLVRPGHPVLQGGRIDLDGFCEAQHLLVAPRGDGRGIVDRRLADLGRERRVSRTVPGFLVAPHLVADSDLLLTLPTRLAHRYASLLGLTVTAPPLELPGFTVRMAWHARNDRDTGHRWLRRTFEEAAQNGRFEPKVTQAPPSG